MTLNLTVEKNNNKKVKIIQNILRRIVILMIFVIATLLIE
jgi:hypothetical protein